MPPSETSKDQARWPRATVRISATWGRGGSSPAARTKSRRYLAHNFPTLSQHREARDHRPQTTVGNHEAGKDHGGPQKTTSVGSAVNELLIREGLFCPVLNLGLPDSFVDHGKRDEQLAWVGLDANGILEAVRERLARLTPPGAQPETTSGPVGAIST